MPRDPTAYLNDMLQAVVDLQELAVTVSIPEKFRNQAMVHLLQILGEAAKNIPAPMRQKAAEIPWKGIAGLRDVIVHEYFRLDFRLVEPLLKDLPLIEKGLRGLLLNA